MDGNPGTHLRSQGERLQEFVFGLQELTVNAADFKTRRSISERMSLGTVRIREFSQLPDWTLLLVSAADSVIGQGRTEAGDDPGGTGTARLFWIAENE